MNETSPRVQGYIGSRSINSRQFPHRVQNLVIRDYCQRRELKYRLSLTEYAPENCYLMLEDALDEVGTTLDGIVFFSLFLLPQRSVDRLKIYENILAKSGSLFFALEELAIEKYEDINGIEDILSVGLTLKSCPFEGVYSKDPNKLREQSFLEACDVVANTW